MANLHGENFKSLAAERVDPLERASPAQASEPRLEPAAAGPSSFGTPVGGMTRDSPGSGGEVDGTDAKADEVNAPGVRPGVVSPGSGLGAGPPPTLRISSPIALQREMFAPHKPRTESIQVYAARITSLQSRLNKGGRAVEGRLFEQLLQTAE